MIPARLGSKSIPKNLRLFNWASFNRMEHWSGRGFLKSVTSLVSTNDTAVAEVARDAGVLAPWMQPAEFGGSTAIND